MTALGWISSVLSIVIGTGTVLTVTVPALRNKLKRVLLGGETSKKQIRQIRCLLEEHVAQDSRREEEAKLQREVDLCVLRDLITATYYRRLEEKKIHIYELEDVSALHDLYLRRGGNSYVSGLYRQMSREWEIIK